MMKQPGLLIFILLLHSFICNAQKQNFTHADSLKGSIGKGRIWWDLTHYELHVKFNVTDSSIVGYNHISFKVLNADSLMQLDLMQPMKLDSIVMAGQKCRWRKDGNAYFVSLPKKLQQNKSERITVWFHGQPRVAKNAPWDGGVIWSKDKSNNPWVSIACQGMAAQVWFPNKDHMYDEADSASIFITTPAELIAVSNGKLRGAEINKDHTVTYNWAVVNPINNYNLIPYLGNYSVVKDTFNGKAGVLDLDYWVLQGNYDIAKKHFEIVKPMLRCFEDWFGPYPFYKDGYKLVEAPFLGMEHQSAIAYGNAFKNGYQGRDLSNTGWGLKWDFIVVHESGHEWFGNSISARDVADNWIHESFTSYAENLFVESLYGKQAGAEYVIGTRLAVQNDKPIISPYNVNCGGSIDLYYKGANMLHTIRQIVDNDSLWKAMLRGINQTFSLQTVRTDDIEDYMSTFLKVDLSKIFNQYLRTIYIPVLEYKRSKNKLSYRWKNSVKDFDMPVKIKNTEGWQWIKPSEKWQKTDYNQQNLVIDNSFYIKLSNL
jgi:aminopeptidase N